MVESTTMNCDELLDFFANPNLEELEKTKKYFDQYISFESKKTIFDFDLSDPSAVDYKENLLECWFALKHKITSDVDVEGSKLIVDHISFDWNIEEIGPKGHGIGFAGWLCFLFCNMFNHSCYSNVKGVLVNHQLVLYVTRPIKAGEQLLYNFE